MKRFIKLIAVLLICSFCAGIVEPAAVNAESKVAINKTKATVMVGETLQLKITGTTDKVTWESSDSDIAKVSSTGKVAGVKAGLATITATVTSKNYSCVVTVNDKDFTVKDGVLTKYNGKSKSVTIPNSVTTIGKNAFKGNKTLESVEIPSTVKSIETLAFVDCINLSAITIPDTVKSIGLGAFYNTKWLSQQQKKDTLVIVNGILIDGITSTGTVTVPDTVTSIGPGAFSNYKRIKVAASTITEIILPDTVTGIGEKAFYGCMKLESITIPDSVTDIGNKAFYICGNLILDVTEGSYLHSYAKKQGVRFRLVKSDNTSDDGKDTGKTEPTPIPSDGGNYYPSDGSSNICTVRFYDGSRFIEGNSVYKGAPLGRVPSVERTSKENAIFVGWYTDTALTQPFYPDNKVTDDMKVYAKYTDLPGETLNITSFALLDQSPDLSFEIVRAANAATAPEDAFTLVTKDGSDVVPLRWEVADDTYTVYADNGFREGCSYELTIANGYFFKGKADTIRTVSFTIAMAEVDNLKMSDEIIYIQDTAEMQYNIPGQAGPVDVLIPSLVPETGGTFTYDGAASLQPGDILCFYIATNPKDRDYLNYSYIDDPEVYVEVENITGNTVTFGALEDEDMELLYNVPDNFPILVAELPTGDIGTININGLDLETYVSILGPTDGTLDNAKAKVSVGDFVSLYTAAYKSAYSAGESTSENDVYYGEVTAYNSITGEITYRITTEKAIEDAMNLYITPDVNGDDLLNEDDRVALEAQLLEQVKKSSFAEDAAFMLADLATKTDGFRSNESIQSLLLSDKDGNPLSEDEIALLNLGASFELTDDIGITVELVTSGDQLHYDNGVQLAIGIDATFEVEIEDEGKVAIDLSASFVEEIALGVNVKGSLVKKKILGIPIPIGVEVNSAVDIKNYTAVNFNVNIYTVAPEEQSTWEKLKDLMADTRVGEVLDKIEELQSKIDQVKEDVETIRGYIQDVESMWQSITTNENNPRVWMETLHKTNITKELMDMMNLSTETGIQSGKYAESMEDLMQKYSEMLETETEWIELINKEIFRFEACYFGLAVSVSGNFITRADINIAMGSSLEYEVGKRYTFWFKIGLFTPTAGSSTMDLIDERFAFQFYVMGKAGLKMGIRAKLSTGIGSTNLASVGIAAELGPYVKVYGFFLYEYEKMRPANSKNWNYSQRKAGALYVDFGVYFILTFEANALSLFEYSHEFINTETSLLTAGEKRFRYGFEFKPQQDEQIRIVDENNDSRDGITMQLPDSLRAISYVDLDTGLLGSESYDYSKYNITLSNPNFSIDNNGKITVNVPTGVQYMECDLTITWLYDKLAFSNYDMSVTIPLVWTNLTSRELNEYFTASVRVGNALEGYQTVWTKRVRKNQAFDLPTTDDIKKLIGYDNYDNGSGTNLKYDELIGYRTDKLKNIAIYTDTVYDFDITLREYSITVNGIQNADGTQTSRVYIAKYGNKFDFSDLTWTGTSIENTSYTKFANVTTTATTSANQVIDLTQPITGKTAIALAADNVTATANYVDDSVVATFEFVGIDYGTITQKLRKNSKPSLAEIEAIAEAANMMIKDITPVVGKLQASTNYIVYLTQMSNIRATIHFEVNGGVQIPDISKIVGSLIGVLPESMRAGYTFAGWYVDSQLTEMFTLDRMSETDITLYAKWTANTYTVTLNANGGSFEGDQNTITIIVVFGESYGELPRPAKTGQGFAGWYTQPEGGELVSRVNIPSDHTLYAQWSEKKTIDDSMMMLDGLTDLVYDGTPKVVTVVSGSVFTVSGGALSVSGSALVPVDTGIFTITYKRTDADDWSDTAINAGLYSVRVSINTAIHTEFAPYEKTFFDIMVINKAPSYFIRTSPNPLTGTVYGRGNITIDKLIPGVDYIGDGTVIYGAINTNYLNDPLYQMWRNSNVLVNLDGNALPGLDYILAAVLAEGENYLGTTEVLMNQDSITIEPGLSHDINSSNGYSFKVRIKTSDIYLAGTDAYIYACLGSNSLPISNGGSTVKAQSQLDDPRVDDFERNSLGEYDLNTVGENFDIMRPMYFELLFNKSGSNPGWHCAWIEIDLYKDGVKLQTSNRINVNRWFENSGDRFETTVQFPRIITGFNDLGDSRDYIDLAADHSGVYNFTLDGIVYDQFRPEGYNAYDYRYSPELTITANGYEDCIERTVNSISIDKEKLYAKMATNNKTTESFQIILSFNDNVTDSRYKTFVLKTVEISR